MAGTRQSYMVVVGVVAMESQNSSIRGKWGKTHVLCFAALSARVPMTVPRVRRLGRRKEIVRFMKTGGRGYNKAYLVFMYLPSLVRSLSDVAFSDPARSMRLCNAKRPSTSEISLKERRKPLPARSSVHFFPLSLANVGLRGQAFDALRVQAYASHSSLDLASGVRPSR